MEQPIDGGGGRNRWVNRDKIQRMVVLETEAGGEISRGGRSDTDELVCGWHEVIGIVWR